MSLAEKSAAVFSRDLFLRVWALGTGIIIARILGPVGVGIWYILLMIPSYAEPFGRLKLDVASVYFLSKGKYKFGEVYFNLIIVSLFSSAIVVLVFFWQRNFILSKLLKDSLDGYLLIYLMFISIPFSFLLTNYSYLFLAKEDVKGYNNLAIIPPVASALLGISLLVTLKWGVFSLVISTLAGGFLGIVYSALRIVRTDKIIYHLNIGMLKEFFKFGWKLYISGFVSHLQVYISGILVAMFLLPEDITFYQMGQQKALMLSMIAPALGVFLYPLVARESDSRANEVTVKACRIGFLTLALLAVIGAVFIKPAVYILYGGDFLPQIFPFWILLPGVVFYGAVDILSPYFIGKGRPMVVVGLSFIPLILQICLCVLLIPLYGVLGAAFATASSYLLTGMSVILVFSRTAKINLADIILPRKMDALLLLNFIKKQTSKYLNIRQIQ